MTIYEQYGWERAEKGADEGKEFARRRQYAADHATSEAMKVLDELCAAYEAKYLRVAGLDLVTAGRGIQSSISEVSAVVE